MLNTIYRLAAPGRFEIVFKDIDLRRDKVIVRPTHLSICHADQRYYQGLRDAKTLEEKLPMALIHEAVGEVVSDPSGNFRLGERAVLIPNTPVETDEFIKENYLRSSRFRASGFDGFMQEYVELDADRLVRLPAGVEDSVAAFTELTSVSVHALSRFDEFSHGRKDVVGIWGDGNLGFITGTLFKTLYPKSLLYVMGTNEDKLADFTFADATFHVGRMPKDLHVDHAFECVGGQGSQSAVDQIIEYIRPEGTIALLGVSEYPIPIYTRMVLEKGLRLFGSSRSGRADFVKTVELYQKNPVLLKYLSSLVGNQIEVRSISDMKEAFERDIHKSYGKTIMIWK